MTVWQRSVCWTVSLMIGVIGSATMPASQASAAEWLAPAAQAQINAGWVQDVAKALRMNRFKNVFMNQPFGCDQCRILKYLNDAADALDNDEPKTAESFVRRALSVLDDGVEDGWYDEAGVRPIKRLIVKKAKGGFQEAGAPALALSVPKKQDRDPRYEQGDELMFSRSDDRDEEYGSRQDRWSGYTSNRRLGLTNERPDRNGRHDQSGRSSHQDSRSQSSASFSDQYLDEAQTMSRSGKDGQRGMPFWEVYGDLMDRWGNQQDTSLMEPR